MNDLEFVIDRLEAWSDSHKIWSRRLGNPADANASENYDLLIAALKRVQAQT